MPLQRRVWVEVTPERPPSSGAGALPSEAPCAKVKRGPDQGERQRSRRTRADDKAFGLQFLTFLVAFAVMSSGITSASTASKFFAENLAVVVGLRPGTPAVMLIALGFMSVLAQINLRGVTESVRLNVVLTLVELSGLLIVVVTGLMRADTVAALGGRTALLLLGVFTIVNVACLVLKRTDRVSHEHFHAPVAVSVLDAATCAFLVGPWTGRDPAQYDIAGVLLGLGVLLWGVNWLWSHLPRRGRA
jgi:amino acid transporter